MQIYEWSKNVGIQIWFHIGQNWALIQGVKKSMFRCKMQKLICIITFMYNIEALY